MRDEVFCTKQSDGTFIRQISKSVVDELLLHEFIVESEPGVYTITEAGQFVFSSKPV